jgi:hypothetical protein
MIYVLQKITQGVYIATVPESLKAIHPFTLLHKPIKPFINPAFKLILHAEKHEGDRLLSPENFYSQKTVKTMNYNH